MRILRIAIGEQRNTQVDRAIAIVVVFYLIEKSILVGISVLNDLLDTRRDRFRRRRLVAAVILGVLVDGPCAPLSPRQMQLAIEYTDVELSTADRKSTRLNSSH